MQKDSADSSSNRLKLPLGSGLSIAEGKDKFVQKLEKFLNDKINGQASIMPKLASDAYQYLSGKHTHTLMIGPVDIGEGLVKALCQTLKVPGYSISATEISQSTLELSNKELKSILIMITDMDYCGSSANAQACIRRNLLPLLRNKNIWVICLGAFNFDEDQPTNSVYYPQQPLRDLSKQQLIETLYKNYGIPKLLSEIIHLKPYVWPGRPQTIGKEQIWKNWDPEQPVNSVLATYDCYAKILAKSSLEEKSDPSSCSGQDATPKLHPSKEGSVASSSGKESSYNSPCSSPATVKSSLYPGDDDAASASNADLVYSLPAVSPNVRIPQKS